MWKVISRKIMKLISTPPPINTSVACPTSVLPGQINTSLACPTSALPGQALGMSYQRALRSRLAFGTLPKIDNLGISAPFCRKSNPLQQVSKLCISNPLYQQSFTYKSKSSTPPPFGPCCLWCNKEFSDSSTLCKPNYCADLPQFRTLFLAMDQFSQGHHLPCDACNPKTYHSSPKELLQHYKDDHEESKDWESKCSACGAPFECEHDLQKHKPFCACVENENLEKRRDRLEQIKRRAGEVLVQLKRFGYKANSGLENPNSKLPKLPKQDP